jgi:hypothetical protein
VAPDRIDIHPADDEGEATTDPEPPIEPGDPSPENVLFVLVGVAVALAVIARLFVLFG